MCENQLIQKGGRNVSSTTVLSAMVITCLVIVVLVALAKPLQGLFRFLLSGIFGSALLFLLGRLGFAVGVNAVTFVAVSYTHLLQALMNKIYWQLLL